MYKLIEKCNLSHIIISTEHDLASSYHYVNVNVGLISYLLSVPYRLTSGPLHLSLEIGLPFDIILCSSHTIQIPGSCNLNLIFNLYSTVRNITIFHEFVHSPQSISSSILCKLQRSASTVTTTSIFKE